jgi:acid phosphatase (class A)
MLSTRRLLLAGFASLALAAPAFAADPYVTAKMLDIATLMPPPPVQGSAEDRADMRAVLDAQAHATAARQAQSKVDSEEDIYTVYGPVLGDKFKAAALPKTTLLFANIGDSEDDTLDAAKPYFGRVRPWIANPAVKAYAKPTKSGSYPSGHTTRAAMYAIVMSEIVPEKTREFWLRSQDYAYSRIVGGMHYPTDIEAGWRAGTAMAAIMKAEPRFQADFAAARAELRAALGLPAEPAK